MMTRMVGMKVASAGTLIVLLAGTIPILTFVVERWVTRTYINPALAAASAAASASAAGGSGPATGTGTAQSAAPAPSQPS
jgi:hypothetical protein